MINKEHTKIKIHHLHINSNQMIVKIFGYKNFRRDIGVRHNGPIVN